MGRKKMRLIDADKTLQEKWSVEIKDMFHMTETVEVVSAIDIEKAPTVEAIPIEWLQKKYDKWKDRDMLGWSYCIKLLIEDWEKENEV